MLTTHATAKVINMVIDVKRRIHLDMFLESSFGSIRIFLKI